MADDGCALTEVPALVDKALKQVAAEQGYKKPRFTVTSGSTMRDGYLSTVYRANIHDEDGSGPADLSVMCKMSMNVMENVMTDVFAAEGHVYGRVLPALEAAAKDFMTSPPWPRAFHLATSGPLPHCVTLEDFRPRGFGPPDRTKPLDLDHCRLVAKQLAKLHAAGFLLKHHQPEKFEAIRAPLGNLFDSEEMRENFKPFMKDIVRMPEMLVDKWPEDSKIYRVMRKACDTAYENFSIMVEPRTWPNDGEGCCLVHGDCQVNNVAFKYDEATGRATDCLLYDFQIVHLAAPTVDLVRILVVSTDRDLRAAHFDDLLRGYLRELHSHLRAGGIKDPDTIYSWDLMQRHMRRTVLWGALIQPIFFNILYSDDEVIAKVRDALAKAGAGEEAQSEMEFTPAMIRSFQETVEDIANRGWLPTEEEIDRWFNEGQRHCSWRSIKSVGQYKIVPGAGSPSSLPRTMADDGCALTEVPALVDKALKQVAAEQGYKKPRFTVTSGSNMRDGYLSTVYRANIHDEDGSGPADLSVMCKMSMNVMENVMTDVFAAEGHVYGRVLPALEAAAKDFMTSPPWPRAFHLATSGPLPHCVTLEDFRPRGFGPPDRTKPLDLDHCRLVTKQLAKLHAAGFLLKHQQPEKFEALRAPLANLFDSEGMRENFKPFMKDIVRMPEMLVDKWPEDSEIYRVMRKACDTAYENFSIMVEPRTWPNDGEGCCLVHGDCQVNNVAFKYDEATGRATDCLLFDFQIVHLASPTVDLVRILVVSTDRELRAAHFDDLLRGYLRELHSHLRAGGIKDPDTIYSWDLMQRHMRRTVLWGALIQPIYFNILYSDDEVIAKVRDTLAKAGAGGEAQSEMEFTPVMMRSFQETVEDIDNRGWLPTEQEIDRCMAVPRRPRPGQVPVPSRRPGRRSRRCPVCALDAGSGEAARRFRTAYDIRLHLFHVHSDAKSVTVRTEAVKRLKRRLNGGRTVHVCSKCIKTFGSIGYLRRHARSCRKGGTGSGEVLDKSGKVVEAVQPKVSAGTAAPAPVHDKNLMKILVEDTLWPAASSFSPSSKSTRRAVQSLASPPVKAPVPAATSTPVDSGCGVGLPKQFQLTGVTPMSMSPVVALGVEVRRRPLLLECPQCSQRLNSSYSLWTHMKRVHTHRKSTAAPQGPEAGAASCPLPGLWDAGPGISRKATSPLRAAPLIAKCHKRRQPGPARP
ncbi:Adenylate cyclase, partial [Frankliniella fusca]